MKPKTLIMCVLAVLLLAVAAWQLADRGDAEGTKGPLVTATEAPQVPVLPEPATAAATEQPAATAAAPATSRPPIKRTRLPDGTILLENIPRTLRYSDGRVEERLLKGIARPAVRDMPAKLRTSVMDAPAPGTEASAETSPTATENGSGSAQNTTGSPAGDGASPPADSQAPPPKADG